VTLFVLLVVICAGKNAMGGSTMLAAMDSCYFSEPDFAIFVDCVSESYDQGRSLPVKPDVQRFYSRLDGLAEQYNSNKITRVQGISAAYKAYKDIFDSVNMPLSK